MKFLQFLHKIYVNILFLEALKEALFYLKFFKEPLSRKSKPKEVSAVPMDEVCSEILQSKSPFKL